MTLAAAVNGPEPFIGPFNRYLAHSEADRIRTAAQEEAIPMPVIRRNAGSRSLSTVASARQQLVPTDSTAR